MKQSETILVLSAVLVFAGGVAGSSQASEPISVDAVSESRDVWTEDTEPLIDLVIVKDASSPTPLHGIVNYTIAVTNKGPDAATDVQVADPAPGSSLAPAIGYLTANPSQGTCNIAPSLLRCGLDTITAGETVTIADTGRARDVGEHTNIATVTGSGGRETNPADNVDDAVTVVPKPLAAPEPVMCLAVGASPKMIRADGRPDRIRVKVVAGKAPVKRARVIVFGAGIRGSARSNASGLAFLTVNPRKAGLLTVTVLDARREVCGVKRIGVVGVWLAPLTG